MGLVCVSTHQRLLQIHHLSLYGFWSIFHSHIFLYTAQTVQTKQSMILFGVFLVLKRILTISAAPGVRQTFGEGGLVWRWFCLKQDLSRSHILFPTHTQFPLNLTTARTNHKGHWSGRKQPFHLTKSFPPIATVFYSLASKACPLQYLIAL